MINQMTGEKFEKEMNKAQSLTKTLGYRSAAGYLRNRGYSLESALAILLDTTERTAKQKPRKAGLFTLFFSLLA